MTDRRLTPDEVIRAYREKGLLPIRHRTIVVAGTCCGMGAVFCAHGRSAVLEAISELGESYAQGFADGFDGETFVPHHLSEFRYKQGYADGKAAYEACVKEFGEVE